MSKPKAPVFRIAVRCWGREEHLVIGPYYVADLTYASQIEIDPCCPTCGCSVLRLCVEPAPSAPHMKKPTHKETRHGRP